MENNLQMTKFSIDGKSTVVENYQKGTTLGMEVREENKYYG